MQINKKFQVKRTVLILWLVFSSALAASCTTSADQTTNAVFSSPEPTFSKQTTPASFTVVTTGDILLHERTWNQAKQDGSPEVWDFYPQLEGIASVTKTADLALCHLETPIANKNENYSGYPVFNSPPEILTAVKELGFDMCDQASNHSLDKGFAGITRTLDKLDQIGIKHTGIARTEQEAKTPLIVEVKAGEKIFKIGIVAYTYGFNGFVRDPDKLWSANEINAEQIINEATAARQAGAQFVIAKLHWGDEYTNQPNSYQIELAQTLAQSGVIDLIEGAHSHSVQPITKIQNMWVAYSHGNLIAAHREPTSIKSEGLIVRWTITENLDGSLAITKVEQIPILITDDFPVRIINVSKALSEKDFSLASESRLQKAYERSLATVNSLGFEIPVGE